MEDVNEQTPKLLRFEKFDTIHTAITLPINFYFMRGRDKRGSPLETGKPLYLTTNPELAETYKNIHGSNGTITMYKNNKPLKLYDLRYIRILILDYLSTPRSKLIPNPEAFKMMAMRLKCAYGACSLLTQIKIAETIYRETLEKERQDKNIKKPVSNAIMKLKEYYNDSIDKWTEIQMYNNLCTCDPVEPLGTRIGETYLDSEMVIVLSELFKDVVDGYIAPIMCAPFQVDRGGFMHSEIVLFNPEEKLEVVKEIPKLMPVSIELILQLSDISRLFEFSSERIDIYTNMMHNKKGGAKVPKRKKKVLYDPSFWFDNAKDKDLETIRSRTVEFIEILRSNKSEQYGGWRPLYFECPINMEDLNKFTRKPFKI